MQAWVLQRKVNFLLRRQGILLALNARVTGCVQERGRLLPAINCR